MTGALKRAIPFAMGHQVDRDGYVFLGRKKLPHGRMRSKYGVDCLSVMIDGGQIEVWKLLQSVFYDSRMIAPRDGNFLKWAANNTVVVPKIRCDRVKDIREVHAVWYWYQACYVPCRNIAERSGLNTFGERDFRGIVQDILFAGIR